MASGFILNKKHLKDNIFAKYFLLFATMFLVMLTILGTTLTLLVNAYILNNNTKLLQENAASVAQSIESTMTVQEMNDQYSVEKGLLCNSLNIISSSIDADIFVCDVEGNIIMCKEKSDASPLMATMPLCSYHNSYTVDDALLRNVYQGGFVGKGTVNGTVSYIVGTPVYSNGQIIGSVFSSTVADSNELTIAVLKIFTLSAMACIAIAFITIWQLTKNFVKPLKQMSTAAKKFAIGDFSYRVKVKGNDELADLGRAFNDMANSLDALESSRRSFVSNVSHELRTPMTSIGGFIDGILDGTIPKNRQDYYLGLVSGEIQRLSRLVVAMLNMSKIESGSFEMKPVKYDITDQIIHILLTFDQKIEEKNIEIKGLEDLTPTHIVADSDMIYQVIYNIFDNAVKFANDGGYISVSMNKTDSEIEVHIKNSGIGIKSDELAKVFERFYKVDKSRSLDAKGAGLGLYIVKMMVEMHGGKVRAQSDDDKSAEFIFTLPKAYIQIYKKEIK